MCWKLGFEEGMVGLCLLSTLVHACARLIGVTVSGRE